VKSLDCLDNPTVKAKEKKVSETIPLQWMDDLAEAV